MWGLLLRHTDLADCGLWNPSPRSGLEPVSSALEGGIPTTGPSPKSRVMHFGWTQESRIMWGRTITAHSQSFSRVWLFVTPWTVALQAPLSMEFSRREYWSGLPFPSPGDLPDPGIKPTSLVSPALADRFFTTVLPGRIMTFIRNQGTVYECHVETRLTFDGSFYAATWLVYRMPW